MSSEFVVWLQRALRQVCFVVIAVPIACLFSALPSVGQTGLGSVNGRVTDAAGAVVAHAQVSIINVDTGVVVASETDSAGVYNFSSLNPGSYRLLVTVRGFRDAEVQGISVSATQTSSIDVKLAVGRANETVTVYATGSLLSPETQTFSTTVDTRLAEALPYPERSSLGAALLAPGVSGDPTNFGQIQSENPGVYGGNIVPGATLSVGGAWPGRTSITIDGSDVTQASFPRAGISISGDNTDQTSIITTGLPAQYGRTAGGVIVQTTKTGTNQFHGTVSYRHTDPFFQAHPIGQTLGAELHQNFFGVTVGGPVILPHLYDGRNRTFFFVSVEPARLSNVVNGMATVPTPDELAGNFANSYTLIDQTVLKNQGADAALAAPRIGHLYYQYPINAQGFPQGALYPNKAQYVQIPNDSVARQLSQNSFASFVLSQYPTPSSPGPHFHFLRPDGLWLNNGYNVDYDRGVKNVDNRYSFRIDQAFGVKDRGFVRYTYIPLTSDRYEGFLPSQPVDPLFDDAAWSRDVAINEVHVFNASVVNELRVMYMRDHQDRNEDGAAVSKDWGGSYGLTPATSGVGFPSISYGYTLSAGISSNITRQIDQNFQYGDDLTITVGRHLLKFGVDLRWLESNQYELSGIYGGNYTFAASQTNNGTTGGNGLASFDLGLINGYTNTPTPVPAYYRWRYMAGFAQDDFRVLPKLTLNLGMRYEVETPRTEKFNRQGTFVPNTSGLLNTQTALGAFCFSGACGLKRTLWPTNYLGIEPRIGISWAPTERATIRASYGIMRVPLSGYSITPAPDFNVSAYSVGGSNGGVTAGQAVDYITNPVGPQTSALTGVTGSGPFFSLNGVTVPYVNQRSSVPYTQQWMFGVQYLITPKTVVQASYAGLKGTHLISIFAPQLNLPTEASLLNLITAHANLNASGSTSPYNPYGITQRGALLSETALQLANPYQNFFNQPLAELYNRDGSSSYNALYLNGTHRYQFGLSLVASFTWSKSFDNVGGDNNTQNLSAGTATVQNPWSLSGERAVSSFDVDTKTTIGYNFDLPFGSSMHLVTRSKFLNRVIGGFSTSGIINAQAGMPFQPLVGSAGYWVSQGGGTALPTSIGNYLRPNIVPGQPCIASNWRENPFVNSYINPARFAVPGSLDNPAFGNARRTLTDCRSPHVVTFDATVRKLIGFGRERSKTFELGITALDVFNHPNFFMSSSSSNHSVFGAFNTASLTNPTVAPFSENASFGILSQANSAQLSRVAQIYGKFTW